MTQTPPGQFVRFFYNDQVVEAIEGQTVAAALLSKGQAILRRTSRRNEPRGIFCGMGVCFDCLVWIDEKPDQQACLIPVVEGMRVKSQIGDAPRSAEP